MKVSQLQIHRPTLIGSTLRCSFSTDNEHFMNTYLLPAMESPPKDDVIIGKFCEWIAITSSFGLFSVDYFTELKTDFPFTAREIAFFEKLAFFGLGEFRIVNNIPATLKTSVISPIIKNPSNSSTKSDLIAAQNPILLNGGGKDGSVSAYLLSQLNIPFTWLQRGSSQAQKNVVASWNAPVLIANRQLDPNRSNRRYSGHRPMSANIAMLATLVAYINGNDAVIASNEASANEGNVLIDGVSINHQYSKSLEFEQDIQDLFDLYSVPVNYFSLLRPLHELQIAFIARQLTDDQLRATTSCNYGTKDATWCLACPKCAFVALVLTVADERIPELIWGRQIINDKALLPFIGELINADIQKPFECIGTLEECQLAAQLLLQYRTDIVEESTRSYINQLIPKVSRPLNHSLITQLEPDSIPEKYRTVLPLMTDSLETWKP